MIFLLKCGLILLIQMKRVFAILIVFLSLALLPLTVIAQNGQDKTNIVLAKNEVINKDYLAAGNTVSLEGTVNGDAYLAGGNIVVDGIVNGDLIAVGGNLDIRGTVTGNIRAAGGNINFGGTVGRNATLAGGSVNIASNANIGGSLASAGGNVVILSPVGKEANLAGGQITIGNNIGGDVNAAAGQISLTSNAAINGNLNYLSENSASISQEATVSGEITQNIPKEKPQETARQGVDNFLNFYRIASFILAAIIGFLLIRFLPVYFNKTVELINKKPWASLGIGLLAAIVLPFILILLFITVIGIPIAIILTFVFIVFIYLAKIFVSFLIGQLVFRQFNIQIHKIWLLLLGLVIYTLVTSIPIFGWLISTIVGLIGLGAALIAKKNYYNELRTKQII